MTNPNHTDTSRSGDLVEAVERYVRVFTSGASDAVKYRAHMNLLGRIEAIEAIETENKQLRREVMKDHARGCEGRNYSCTCGYDDKTADLIETQAREIERLRGLLREAEVKLTDVQGAYATRQYSANLLTRIRAALGETFEDLGQEFDAVWDVNRDKLYEGDTK